MKFTFDHDYHIHSQLSSCSADPGQTARVILQYAIDRGLKKICITDHFWDESVDGASGWYKPQNFEHISKIKPLPQADGVEFLFGVISLPEMEEKNFNNLMGYFYTMTTQDPQLQPFGKEPSFSLNLVDEKDLDLVQAKRNVPPVLKAYIAMGCSFAKTGNMQNRLLKTKDILVMMDIKKINKRYVEFITR